MKAGRQEAGGDAIRVLSRIAPALAAYEVGGPTPKLDIEGLDRGNRELIDQVLGEGEVVITVSGPVEARINESVLTGVWRVKTLDGAGRESAYHIEIADIPDAVRRAAVEGALDDLSIGTPPEGAMNVMPVLAEIRERMERHRPGSPAYVLNLSYLPMTPADTAFLQETLGRGSLRMVSRGYGACRIEATRRRHVWLVRFLDSQDMVILDTVEIGGVPALVLAAREDFEDSAERLKDILEAYA
jgi:hydrogenase-1 operon protein HyaF